jgi:hypothetical protein
MITTKDWWDDFPDLEQDLEENFALYYRKI